LGARLASADQMDDFQLVTLVNLGSVPLIAENDFTVALYGHARGNDLQMRQQSGQGEFARNFLGLAIDRDFHSPSAVSASTPRI
jgi:hypothetical protein